MENTAEKRLWRAMVAVLRITVALQCVGNWRLLVRVEESPLMALLWDQPDVGGWGWTESAALAAQHAVGWFALLAGLCVLLRPCAAVVGPLALLQLAFAVAMWRTDSGYTLDIAWLSSKLTALFPLATQSARIATPLALLWLDPWLGKRPLGEQRVAVGIGLLRWSLALTFLAHAWEAWQHNPVFVDLWINSADRLFGWDLSQQKAEAMLTAIAVVDLLVAAACVGTRWRSVLWWMAFWGAITAASHIVAKGWQMSWHETLTRAPHAGIPLVVVLYWHLLQCRTNRSQAEKKKG